MNIPPLIRVGPLPMPDPINAPRMRYVMLLRDRGWHIGRRGFLGAFVLVEPKLETYPAIDVLCWMPVDGS